MNECPVVRRPELQLGHHDPPFGVAQAKAWAYVDQLHNQSLSPHRAVRESRDDRAPRDTVVPLEDFEDLMLLRDLESFL